MNDLAERVRREIFEEYDPAKALVFPMFPIKVNGNTIDDPNLMQRVVVINFLKKKNLGNWSDMGTGKTLAAVLCSYAIKAKLTVICCPNSVREEWATAEKIADDLSACRIRKIGAGVVPYADRP